MNDPHLQTSTDSFAREVIERIHAERIRPHPKWTYKVEHLTYIAIGITSVAIGALALSAVFSSITSAPTPERESFIQVPILWLAVFILFFVFSLRVLRSMKRGYRHTPLRAIGTAVMVSLVLGTLFSIMGIGEMVETDTHTYYRQIIR